MRKLLFEILNSLGIAAFLKSLRVRNREITILMLHRISDEKDLLWNPIPLKSFELLIKKLKKETSIIQLERNF